MKNSYPIILVFLGLLFISVGLNIVLYEENLKLIEIINRKPRVIIIRIIEQADILTGGCAGPI